MISQQIESQIQLSPTKPNIKKICKNVENNATLLGKYRCYWFLSLFVFLVHYVNIIYNVKYVNIIEFIFATFK